MASITVQRVDFGYFVRPSEETGTGAPRVEPCLGYVVGHPAGPLLFDTGMGSHPEVDAHYRPRRAELEEALAAIGVTIADLRLAANSHLHFDHCGGNPKLAQLPVFVQAAELRTARQTPDYTLPELIDRSRFEQVTGPAEVVPGVTLMPTLRSRPLRLDPVTRASPTGADHTRMIDRRLRPVEPAASPLLRRRSSPEWMLPY
jgi:N-acyl homoserine lactone hydrolase